MKKNMPKSFRAEAGFTAVQLIVALYGFSSAR